MVRKAFKLDRTLKALVRAVLPYLVMVTLLAVLLASTVTFRKYLNDYSAGTLQGLFIALIPVMIYLAYQQATIEYEKLKTIEKVKDSLSGELKAIKVSLDQAVKLRGEQISYIPHVDIVTDVMQSVVSSGKFTLLETEIQLELSHVYAVVERARDYLSRMKDFLASPALALSGREKIFASLGMNFWGQVEHLRKVIPKILEKLRKSG
jgi:hypothetical protein